jgi:hypothetical protein
VILERFFRSKIFTLNNEFAQADKALAVAQIGDLRRTKQRARHCCNSALWQAARFQIDGVIIGVETATATIEYLVGTRGKLCCGRENLGIARCLQTALFEAIVAIRFGRNDRSINRFDLPAATQSHQQANQQRKKCGMNEPFHDIAKIQIFLEYGVKTKDS